MISSQNWMVFLFIPFQVKCLYCGHSVSCVNVYMHGDAGSRLTVSSTFKSQLLLCLMPVKLTLACGFWGVTETQSKMWEPLQICLLNSKKPPRIGQFGSFKHEQFFEYLMPSNTAEDTLLKNRKVIGCRNSHGTGTENRTLGVYSRMEYQGTTKTIQQLSVEKNI